LLEGLAPHAVETLVAAEVYLSPVEELLDELLHRFLVALLGGPDEVVVGDAERLPDLRPAGDHRVGPFLGAEALLLGRPEDLLTVLIGAGEEMDPPALHPSEAGEEVGGHRRVGVPQMGDVIHVVDGGCDVKDLVAHPIPDSN
jgi:hypothetical protein